MFFYVFRNTGKLQLLLYSITFQTHLFVLTIISIFSKNMYGETSNDNVVTCISKLQLLKEQSPSHATSVAEIQACRPKTRYTNILPCELLVPWS